MNRFFNKDAWAYCYGLNFNYDKLRDGNVCRIKKTKASAFKLFGVLSIILIGVYVMEIDIGVYEYPVPLIFTSIIGVSYLATLPWIPGIERPDHYIAVDWFSKGIFFLCMIATMWFGAPTFLELLKDSFDCAISDGKKDYSECIKQKETDDAYASHFADDKNYVVHKGIYRDSVTHLPFRFRSTFFGFSILFSHILLLGVLSYWLWKSIPLSIITSLSVYGISSILCLTWYPGRKYFPDSPIILTVIWYILIAILCIPFLGAPIIVLDLHASSLYGVYIDTKISAKFKDETGYIRKITYYEPPKKDYDRFL